MELKLRLGKKSNTDKKILVGDLLSMVFLQQDAYSSSWIVAFCSFSDMIFGTFCDAHKSMAL